MANYVLDKDMGFKVTLARLSSLHGSVKVGIFADAGSSKKGHTSIAEYAAYNEFGTSHIPSRPFMRQTIDKYTNAWGQAAEAAEKRVADGMSPHQALELIGNIAEGHIKATIGRGSFAPNAANTIKQKGSSQPLIDTGAMRGAVRHKVE